jgi:hypothetical protein
MDRVPHARDPLEAQTIIAERHRRQCLLILLKIEPQRGLGSQPVVRDDPMQKPILALLAMLLAGLASAHGAEVQVGRYQMIAVPASQFQTFPETLLLDTTTGQTWMLYHET